MGYTSQSSDTSNLVPTSTLLLYHGFELACSEFSDNNRAKSSKLTGTPALADSHLPYSAIQPTMNSTTKNNVSIDSGFKLQPPPSQSGVSGSRPPRGRRLRQNTESSVEGNVSITSI